MNIWRSGLSGAPASTGIVHGIETATGGNQQQLPLQSKQEGHGVMEKEATVLNKENMRPAIHYAITAAAGAIALSAGTTPAIAVSFDAGNPFFAPSTLPFQAPAFDKIQDSDYQPAIEAGMAQQLEEMRAIAD